MKPSVYNFHYRLETGIVVFFNFFTLSLIALEGAKAGLALRILEEPERAAAARGGKTLIALFRKHGFLVDDAADEIGYLRAQHLRARADSGHLSLTILPTLACNFSCVYCYQAKRAESMSPEVEDALIEYVGRGIEGRKSLFITWFGGEPLLRPDLIERLSRRFIGMCERHGASYGAHIVTNGYLMDGAAAKRLAGLRITEAQVTLDGPAAVHDRRRPLADGRGTFRKILSNLKAAAPVLEIQVRMNVDDDNRSSIPGLLDRLVKEGLQDRLGFYLGQTYPYTPVCQDVAGSCLRDDEFSLLELETALDMSERGFGSYRSPRSRDRYCMADGASAFAVTPSGGLTKCWNDVASPADEVGHLLKGPTRAMARTAAKWEKRDPFALECRSCLALPICMGGCPHNYHRSGKLRCHDWKLHPAENLVLYYAMKKREQETALLAAIQEAVLKHKGKPRRNRPDGAPRRSGYGPKEEVLT